MAEEKKELRMGFWGLAGRLLIENDFLIYENPIGLPQFKVQIKDIETVTVDATLNVLFVRLRIIGKGTELAAIKEFPTKMAARAQEWILENIKDE